MSLTLSGNCAQFLQENPFASGNNTEIIESKRYPGLLHNDFPWRLDRYLM